MVFETAGLMIGSSTRRADTSWLVDLVLVGAIASVPLFWRLGAPPIHLWDEARVAINAIEMMSPANLLVGTFHGEPDLWNNKPPFALWLFALSMKCFAVNELALRLPSAAAALATVLLVYVATRRVCNSRTTSVLASLLLAGTGGYVARHVTRTADYDSLLVLAITATTFALFYGLESLGRSTAGTWKWLNLAAAGQVCAFLTKGVAGLLMLPGYALYVLWFGRHKELLASRAAWVAGAATLGSVGLFFFFRDLSSGGYLYANWTDAAGRFTAVSDKHSGPWYFYIARLLTPWPLSWPDLVYVPYASEGSAFPFSWTLPVSVWLAVRSRDALVSRFSLYLLCCLLGFIVIISAAATKVSWYSAPAFPLIAVLTAIGVREFSLKLRALRQPYLRWAATATMPLALCLGLLCIMVVVWKTGREIEDAPMKTNQQLPSFIRWFASTHPGVAELRAVGTGRWKAPQISPASETKQEPYNGQEEFYVVALRARQINLQIVELGYAPQASEVLLGCGQEFQAAYRNLRLVTKRYECSALQR